MKQGLRPLLLGCQVAAAALSLQALASAQCPTPNIGATVTSPPVPQPGLTEVWVDPINGNDATGIVGDGTQPFLTATTALNQLQLALTASGGASAANRGLVHLDAGIYSLTTNGETFPIVMSDFVDIQGIGAKQTVLRGTADATVEAFRPLTDSSCNCGVRDQNIVLVDFSDAIDDEYDEMIDGVTFQGADIQVYAEAREHAIDGRISNCVFDLLDGPNSEGVGYAGPDFGILMVHAVQSDGGGGPKGDPTDPPGTGDPTDPPIGGDPTDPPGTGDDGNGGVSYNDVRLHVFNNTFVQSWDRDGFVDPEPDVSAADTSVAICDVNDPACGSANPDPNPLLRGVGNPNIQNNLIRAFDDTPPIALMGIDNADVTCAVGTRLGATNAFDPAAVAGPGIPFPSGLAFCSTIVGALPTVVTDTASGLALNPNGRTGGQDPAFVGEALAVSIPGLLPAGNGRDWRLIASSIYADDGTLPILATGILGAANGTQHTDLNCAPQSSFDLDGEYWGNDRVAASPLLAVGSAALVDIGYDEIGILIDAGMANDSIVHAPMAVPQYGPFLGLGFRVLLFPQSAPGVVDFQSVSAINTPLALFPAGFTAYSHFPGTLTLPVPAPFPFLPAPFNIVWLDVTGGLGLFTYLPLSALGEFAYVSPFDMTAKSFSLVVPPSAAAQTMQPAYFAEQAFYLPAGGPNAGQILLSNHQGVHD